MLRPSWILMNQAGDPPPGGTPPPAGAPPAPNGAPPAINAKAEAARLLGYDPDNPPWLAGRLEEANARKLKELGITDPAKAKATLEAAAKLEEEQRTVAERLASTTTQLTTAQTEAERYKAVTTEFAARQMMGLSAEQQAAVKAIAGEDAAAQLRAITALQPTWAAQSPAPPLGGTPPAPGTPPPPPVPPTGTAPAPNAPPGAGSGSPPNHREVHASLLKTNPFAAAQYGLEHAREVFPEQS